MDIFLDGQLIDATLELERNVSEILRSLSDWVDSEGGSVSEVRVNGEIRGPGNEKKWDAVPLGEISRIEIRTRSRRERDLEELEILSEYFTIMEECLLRGDRAALADIFSEYSYVRSNLGVHLQDFICDPVNGELSALDRIARNLEDSDEDAVPEGLTNPAAEYVRGILHIIAERVRELSDPKSEAAIVVRTLGDKKVELEQVSLLLQTGKDSEAMRSIIATSECILKAVRLLSLLPRTADLDSFRDGLNAVLKELREAFTVKDSVLIGDLMEYEIAPKTEILTSLLDRHFLKENMP